MRSYLARKAQVKPSREFFLLGALGQDLPGAVTIKSHELDAELGFDSEDTAASSDHQENVDSDTILRFSLAGVQLKFSAVQEAAGGLTIPARGVGGKWIVKLPSAAYTGVPENEFSMMELARQTGLNIPKTKLVGVDKIKALPEGMGTLGGNALAIQRFDRQPDGESIHIEDFAQVFGVYPDDKYEKVSYGNMAKVILLEAGEDAVIEFVRRLVFNAMIGNADMHLKNWSLIYPDRRTPMISPAYDLVSTISYMPDDRKMALSIDGIKDMYQFSWERLEAFISDARLPRTLILNAVEETVARFREAWEHSADHLPLSKQHVEIINGHFPKVPIATDKRPR